jgi:PRA1 family protein
MFKLEHLRSITVYFGIGEERPFYFEKTPSLLMERLRHNATFFFLNYMLLTAVLFVLTLFISPTAIVGIALLAAAWMWVIRASSSGSLTIGSSKCTLSLSPEFTVRVCHALCMKHFADPWLIGMLALAGISIPQKTATIIMAVVSVFCLIYLLSGIFWLTLFWAGLLIALHAFFRDASMHKDMEDIVTMEGDLNLGEDASFLNTARVDQV